MAESLRERSFTIAHATGEKRPVVFLHVAEAELDEARTALYEAIEMLDNASSSFRDPALRSAWGRKRKALRAKWGRPPES